MADLSLVDHVAGQAVAAAELADLPAQDRFGAFQPLMLVAAFGETSEELLDQRRNRSSTLSGNDTGTMIRGVVQ